MDKDVSKALSLPEVRYSRVWEDHRVLSKALCIQPRDTVLCITSSGENVLNLLLDEPIKLIAIDVSVAQNSLLELKLGAIRCLCFEDYLILLGETTDSLGRWKDLYATVKQNGSMSAQAQQYWDKYHESLMSNGSWFGKFEQYMTGLHRSINTVLSQEQVDTFLSALSLEKQRQIFDQWPTDKIRDIYIEFTSPTSQLKGRDAAQLKFLQRSEEEIGDLFWTRLSRVCRDVPVGENFYLNWFLQGKRGCDPIVQPNYGPPCLTKEGFTKLKGLVDRVVVYTGAIEDYFTHATSTERPTKLALSNIFEYMSQESADELFDKLASHVACGGRIAYWECLVPRSPSPTEAAGDVRQRLCPLQDLQDELRREDRSMWFVFYVVEVK